MKLLSIKALIEKTSLSRAQILRMVKDQTIPAPLKISPRRSAWIDQIIDDWIMSISTRTAAGKSEGVHHDFI